VTYGSIQNGGKINPKVLETWVALLKKDPTAHLLLKCYAHSPEDWSYYVEQFEAHGIDPSRIEYGGDVSAPYLEGMALHNKMDIWLDTWPYGGTTTLCDALYMGVPVVTRRGDRHQNMAGESIIGTTLGIKELVAEDDADVVKVAHGLGQQQKKLSDLRQTLPGLMEKTPLMDAAMYMPGLKGAYRGMWKHFVAATRKD
jgi:protein O-GlcNAc transferase